MRQFFHDTKHTLNDDLSAKLELVVFILNFVKTA